MNPLREIFNQKPHKGHLRQIFVLTDGSVSNSDEVVRLVRRNAQAGRVFSLGLGSYCDRHLVKGIARSGNGTAVFSAEGEDLRPKVMSQLKNALQPAINDIRVIWNGVDESKLGMQVPNEAPPIFDGSRLLVFRHFSALLKPQGVKITAETPDGPLTVDLDIEECTLLISTDNLVHKLAARRQIQELEENSDKRNKEEIVKLATRYRLASKFTSFVGIDCKENKEMFAEMATREIANQVPAFYGRSRAAAAHVYHYCSAPVMAMACESYSVDSVDLQSSSMQLKSSRASPLKKLFSRKPSKSKKAEAVDVDEMDDQRVESDAPLSGQDLMFAIIDLQKAAGSFKWGKGLETLLGISEKEMKTKAKENQIDLEDWITAVCIAYLESQVDAKDMWELVVDKAKSHLKNKISDESLLKKVTEAAKKEITNQ